MPDKGILILYGSLSKNRALLACSEKCNITFFKKKPKTPRQNGPLCPVVGFYQSSTTFNHFLPKNQGFGNAPNPLQILVIVSGFEPLAYRLGASKEHLITLKGRGFRASRSFFSHSSAT